MKKHLLHLCCPALTLTLLPILIATHSLAQSGGDPQNPLFRNIPPDATTVYHVNLPVLNAQISWQELIEMIPVSKMGAGDPSTAALLRDPALAGIDIGKDIIIAEKAPGADSVGYTTVILHLLDSAKFRAALRKEVTGLKTFVIPNRDKIRLAGKDMQGAAWSKDLAVLVLAKASLKNQMAAMAPHAYKADPPGKANPPVITGSVGPAKSTYTLAAAKRGLAVIQGFDGSFYTTDPVFREGFSDGAAFHVWSGQGQGLAMLVQKLVRKRIPIGDYLKTADAGKSNTLISIRLESGRISMAFSSVATPQMKAMYEKMNIRPLNMELQSRIPAGNVMALINLRLYLPTIDSILRQTGLTGKIDSLMSAKGLPLDTLLNAFTGDLQLAMMEPTVSADNGKPKFPMYFVTTIKDPSAFYKVEAAIKTMSDSAAIDSAIAKRRNPLEKLKGASTFRDNILVISGSKELSDGWFSNTEKRNTDFLTGRVRESPFSLVVDFRVVSHFVQSMYKDKEPPAKDKKMLDLLSRIDRLEITGGAIKDDKVESFIELKLTDLSSSSIRNFIKGFH